MKGMVVAVKETKIRVICNIICVIAYSVCIAIDLYLAFSKGQYLYLIPACLWAIGLVINIKSIKGFCNN